MQRKWIVQGMLLLIILVIMVGCQKEQTKLEVDVEIGYEQIVKLSEGNPLKVRIRNLSQAIEGEIQIDIATDGQSQIVLAVPFDISQGAEKVLDLHIPIYTVQKKFPVRIVVDGNNVYEDDVIVRQFLPPERAIVGVVSDQPDQYRFFNRMELEPNILDEERQAYERMTLEEGGILEDTIYPHIIYFNSIQDIKTSEALNFFDYIYIGNASNLGFDELATNNIVNWIKQGNTLLVETGANYQRTMNQLPEVLKQVHFDQVKNKNIDFSDTNLPFVGQADLADGQIVDDQVTMIQVKEVALAYSKFIGAGRLITLSMDLSAKPFSIWNTDGAFLSHLMELLDIQSHQVQGDKIYYGNNSYQLRYIPIDQEPPYGLMALILGLYSVIVGPIIYFVLKKKDRRDLMWIVVPLLSISCVIFIYLLGFMTRYDQPISNSISEINYQQDTPFLAIDSEIALFNNKNERMTISWDSNEDFMISTLNDAYYYGEIRENKQTKGKLFLGRRKYYESYDATLWEPTFADGKKIVPIEKQDIDETVQIGVFGETIDLTVTNPTPIQVEYTTVVWGNQLFNIGTLEPYQQKTISAEGVRDSYQYLEENYQVDQFYQNPKSFSAQVRSDVSFLEDRLYRVYEENRNRSMDQVILVGINCDDVGYSVQINDHEVDVYSRNLVTMTMDANFEFGEEIKLAYGFIQPEIYVERYDHMEEGYSYIDGQNEIIDLYETDQIFYTWTLPVDLPINQVRLRLEELYSNEVYYNKLRNNSPGNTSKGEPVDLLIKNIHSEEWETMETQSREVEVDLTKYLSQDQKISICYDMTGLNRLQSDYTMIVPAIYVEGGRVND